VNDKTLTNFIAWTEEGRISEVAATLTVSGGIVSGIIASTTEYAEWLAQTLNQSMKIREQPTAQPQIEPDVATRLLHEALSDPTQLDALEETPQQAGSVDVPTLPKDFQVDPDRLVFIHIRNASIWFGGMPQPVTAQYWRGRLEFVNGWVLGQLTS
jgi:hypothetical protein